MSISVLWSILLLLLLFFASAIWHLARNYREGREVGLPIIIVPISPENPIWMILARYLIPILQYVPFGKGYFTRFCHLGWEFDDKARAHLELGDAFMFVTPGKNWIYLCIADTAHDVIRRERQGDFARSGELMAFLDVFGPNISTVGGYSFFYNCTLEVGRDWLIFLVGKRTELATTTKVHCRKLQRASQCSCLE